jgi:hypothetical protein
MTKKTLSSQEVRDSIEASPAELTPEVSEHDLARADQYLRDTALGYAITFHKNNGGMLHAAQIIDNANAFLAFLKGVTK